MCLIEGWSDKDKANMGLLLVAYDVSDREECVRSVKLICVCYL